MQIKSSYEWVKINSLDDMPKKKYGENQYEQYTCIVLHKGQEKEAVWNCEHLCWDDPSGDDWMIDALEPTAYMLMGEFGDV